MKIKIHPLFIFYILFLIIIGQLSSVMCYFFCVLVHEFAHSFVANKLGYKLGYLKLMPYGVCLNYNTNCFYNNDEIYIAISGPCINLVLALITISLWWIFPSTYTITNLFCYSNIVMFVFNLLPCYPLDGGRVLVGYLSKTMSRKTAIKISIIFNIIISLIFILIFFIGLFYKITNFNLIIISIFLLGGILDNKSSSKYEYIKYQKNSKSLTNKAIPVKSICISSKLPIYKILPKLSKNKFNIIYIIMENSKIKVINENTIDLIINKFNITDNFEYIFNKIMP